MFFLLANGHRNLPVFEAAVYLDPEDFFGSSLTFLLVTQFVQVFLQIAQILKKNPDEIWTRRFSSRYFNIDFER